MSAIEDLLLELETGSDDDRSVAHACRIELDAAAAANAEHEGRLRTLNEKAEEARREWISAENAEAERDRLRTALESLIDAATPLYKSGRLDASTFLQARAAFAPKETKDAP